MKLSMNTHLVSRVCLRSSFSWVSELSDCCSLAPGANIMMLMQVWVWGYQWCSCVRVTDGGSTCFAWFKTNSWWVKTVNQSRQMFLSPDSFRVQGQLRSSSNGRDLVRTLEQVDRGQWAYIRSALLTSRAALVKTEHCLFETFPHLWLCLSSIIAAPFNIVIEEWDKWICLMWPR